ncbi:hypothetical protein RJ640_001504 [Escallonia rubra]|uniref:Retrotransposon gag domain-containing protein n=1 Tax=Escallonia rubra TaxID=112253 RepID=A0AA88R563_9ASTE|nr:hypothetical protein RJ640_001504 [Escallonia rubra]
MGNDEMKLSLATFRLENDAACWWEMIDSKWTAAQTVRTWELFKTEFNKNYIPRSVKLKREAEFLNFEQGNLTVQQYATKFTSLAEHASYLVEGGDRRVRKFQDCLKPKIQEKISILNIDEYYEMVDRALLIEKSDGDIQRKRARLSGTRPNLSNWQGGRNLNTGGNKVQRAGAYNNQGSMQQPKGKLATQQIQQVQGYKLTCSYCGKLGIILILAGGRKGNVRMADREASSLGKDADNVLNDMHVILGRMVPCMEN